MDLTEIIVQYEQYIWYLIHSFMRDNKIPSNHGDDIYQDAMIRMFNKLPTYDPERSSIKTFLTAQIRIACMRYRRALYQHVSGQIDDIEYNDDEAKIQLMIATSNLTDLEKDILKLRYEGYTQTEIASQLGIAQGTVSKMSYKIKDKLERLLLTK